jgi:protein involved in polysaccharide export with SLBB domain
MKIKTVPFFAVLLAVSSLMAQSGPDQSSSANKVHSKNSEDDITVQGCLTRATGNYVLMQTDPSNTYKLEEVNRKIKLGPHLGEQVEVTGWESPSLSTSSDYNRAGVSSLTLMVTSIRTLNKHCTHGEVSASHGAASVSGTQLEVSSTPEHADIEIDGNFVGHTASVVSVPAGQHQLVVKKSGYKPWEKKIEVTSGQVKVHAELERVVK